jgi:hypothetical protein
LESELDENDEGLDKLEELGELCAAGGAMLSL